MKKFLVTILAFVYLTASSGATINMHYCMGKLMAWDLSQKQDDTCGTCGMGKTGHKGCCKDEQKIIQIEKDQKISESTFRVFNLSSEIISLTYYNLPSVYSSSIITANLVANPPPDLYTVPIFLRNCNFRI